MNDFRLYNSNRKSNNLDKKSNNKIKLSQPKSIHLNRLTLSFYLTNKLHNSPVPLLP